MLVHNNWAVPSKAVTNIARLDKPFGIIEENPAKWLLDRVLLNQHKRIIRGAHLFKLVRNDFYRFSFAEHFRAPYGILPVSVTAHGAFCSLTAPVTITSEVKS